MCYDATNGAKINQVNTCNLADSRPFLMLNFDLMIILRASPTRERPPPDAVADEALQQLKPWSHELLLNAHGKLLPTSNSLPYNLTLSYNFFFKFPIQPLNWYISSGRGGHSPENICKRSVASDWKIAGTYLYLEFLWRIGRVSDYGCMLNVIGVV